MKYGHRKRLRKQKFLIETVSQVEYFNRNGFASRKHGDIPRPKPPQKWQTPKTPLTIPFKFLSQFGVNLHSNSGLNLTRKLGVGDICKTFRGYLVEILGEIKGKIFGGFLVTTLEMVVGCEIST